MNILTINKKINRINSHEIYFSIIAFSKWTTRWAGYASRRVYEPEGRELRPTWVGRSNEPQGRVLCPSSFEPEGRELCPATAAGSKAALGDRVEFHAPRTSESRKCKCSSIK